MHTAVGCRLSFLSKHGPWQHSKDNKLSGMIWLSLNSLMDLVTVWTLMLTLVSLLTLRYLMAHILWLCELTSSFIYLSTNHCFVKCACIHSHCVLIAHLFYANNMLVIFGCSYSLPFCCFTVMWSVVVFIFNYFLACLWIVSANWPDKQHLQKSQFWRVWFWIWFWNQRGQCTIVRSVSLSNVRILLPLSPLWTVVCSCLCCCHIKICRMTNYELLRWLVETRSLDVGRNWMLHSWACDRVHVARAICFHSVAHVARLFPVSWKWK